MSCKNGRLSCLPETACAGEWDFQKDLAYGRAAAGNLVLKFACGLLMMGYQVSLPE